MRFSSHLFNFTDFVAYFNRWRVESPPTNSKGNVNRCLARCGCMSFVKWHIYITYTCHNVVRMHHFMHLVTYVHITAYTRAHTALVNLDDSRTENLRFSPTENLNDYLSNYRCENCCSVSEIGFRTTSMNCLKTTLIAQVKNLNTSFSTIRRAWNKFTKLIILQII